MSNLNLWLKIQSFRRKYFVVFKGLLQYLNLILKNLIHLTNKTLLQSCNFLYPSKFTNILGLNILIWNKATLNNYTHTNVFLFNCIFRPIISNWGYAKVEKRKYNQEKFSCMKSLRKKLVKLYYFCQEGWRQIPIFWIWSPQKNENFQFSLQGFRKYSIKNLT